MALSLEDALKALDANNDEHWTVDGAPSLNYVRELTDDTEKEITRELIIKVAPELTREALIAKADPQPAPTQAETPADIVAKEEGLHDEVASLDQEISEIDQKMAALDNKKHALMAQRQQKAAHSTEYNHRADQQRKIDYIKKQNEIRIERATRRAKFLGSAAGAVKPGDFDPRAKIDQAMARKNVRGAQRPQVPLKG